MTNTPHRGQPQRRSKDAPPLFDVPATHHMPAEQPGAELAVPQDHVPDVLHGDVVPAEQPTAQQQPRTITATVRTVRAVVTDVATHDHTRTAARHLAYVAVGTAVATRRLWESRTTARYERMMRSAEAAGDHAAALEWEARAAAFRRDRHTRRMDLFALPVKAVILLPKVAAAFTAVLAAIGVLLAIADHDIREVAAPVVAVAQVVRLVAIVVSVAWGPLLLAVPWVMVVALWQIGRTHGMTGMGWTARLQDEAEQDGGIVVTADGIVLALQHLRIAELKRALKDGWLPMFHQPPVRDGRGYWAVVTLPLGVTAQMVADQRQVLARNLLRAEVEVWPSDAEKVGSGPAGCLDLWVADSGALSKAAPEYPLLHEGAADVFEGVPAGVSPRGDVITVPIVGNNFVAGGQMGQGKSNACRVVILGASLDPLAEIDVFVFANNGDFDAYAPRLATYAKGLDDETAERALNRLRWLYGEVARREDRLAALGAKKVTRKLAEQHPDLRPVLSLFSECHELFGHPEYGEEAGELACKTAKRARKTAIWLGFDTQSSRADAIPPKLVELVSVNACFYVKTWRSNDGFLGDGSFQAGIRATELRPGRDRGTSLITGVSDNMFELLRWYFVAVDDDTGWDAAVDVIARAVAQLAPGTRTDAPAAEWLPDRDLLDDLAEVLGAERARLKDLAVRLRDLAPGWPAYKSLTGVRLSELLAEEGVRVITTGNRPSLDPADLRRALAGRDAD